MAYLTGVAGNTHLFPAKLVIDIIEGDLGNGRFLWIDQPVRVPPCQTHAL